jgi:uncharacterized membrane protein YdfJ with MMPL/SSD domain
MVSSPHSAVQREYARPKRLRVVAGVAAVATMAATLALTQQPQTQDNSSASQPRAASQPAANAQMEMHEQPSKKNKFEIANAERRKQISDDAAKLLELATELKTEVDKTDKDTLSLQVIRKAETIEKLAKGVKEKMKQTPGAS